ncbi:MAG: adenylate/guanylate cyclase domain-containing protein [Deltaproteobacteria bacterium]|nr:adenylate/guanylate cyclase domain-containing protein [Deltaproteobacteria bacterium]
MPDSAKPSAPIHFLRQLRLFLEELCCEIARFQVVGHHGLGAEAVTVAREVDLGVPGAFADVVVRAPGRPPFFLEVKVGYAADRMVEHFARKYQAPSPAVPGADRVIVVVDRAGRPDFPELEARLRKAAHRGLALEFWDEERLRALVTQCFGVGLPAMTDEALADLRNAIDDIKWRWAFGERHVESPLKTSLLWHFGYSRLLQLHKVHGFSPEQILPPRRFRNAVVLLADLSSFSSFVRDTRDDEVMRDALTTFYSGSRYAVINTGGMVSQFVGDELLALFGVPDVQDGYALRALECARSLLHIGSSVSNRWQREIDRVQPAGGVHIGIAMGDIQSVLYRPFCRSHVGVVGDAVNVGARLLAQAATNQIVVSNTYFRTLPDREQAAFQELEPLEAKNVGLIKAWKLVQQSSYSTRGA